MRALIALFTTKTMLSETEVDYDSTKQLRDLVKLFLKEEPGAIFVQAYNKTTRQSVCTYRKLNNGKMVQTKKNEHPLWGGAREGSGRKPKTDGTAKRTQISLSLDDSMAQALEGIENKQEYIRSIIREKLTEQGQAVMPEAIPREVYVKDESDSDKRYTKLLRTVKPTIRWYSGATKGTMQFRIERTSDNLWKVGYYSDEVVNNRLDYPETTNETLLSALEWMQDWISEHKSKYFF